MTEPAVGSAIDRRQRIAAKQAALTSSLPAPVPTPTPPAPPAASTWQGKLAERYEGYAPAGTPKRQRADMVAIPAKGFWAMPLSKKITRVVLAVIAYILMGGISDWLYGKFNAVWIVIIRAVHQHGIISFQTHALQGASSGLLKFAAGLAVITYVLMRVPKLRYALLLVAVALAIASVPFRDVRTARHYPECPPGTSTTQSLRACANGFLTQGNAAGDQVLKDKARSLTGDADVFDGR